MSCTPKPQLLELQRQIRLWESTALPSAAVRSTGCPAVNELFPAQGVREGTLVEWLGEGAASGGPTLSLSIGRNVCLPGRPIVVIDTQHELFPVGLEGLGFDLAQVVLVRPASEREALWAGEEVLRCEGIGLVWMRLERLSHTSFRRLKLAAEASRGIGFLQRSSQSLRQPSWADARLLVRPRSSREASPCFQVEVTYSQGRPRRAKVDIMLNSWQGTIHEVSPASPANSVCVVS
jgi:protein ImuA